MKKNGGSCGDRRVSRVARRESRKTGRDARTAMRDPRLPTQIIPLRRGTSAAATDRKFVFSRDLRHLEKIVDEHGLKDAVRYTNLHGGALRKE